MKTVINTQMEIQKNIINITLIILSNIVYNKNGTVTYDLTISFDRHGKKIKDSDIKIILIDKQNPRKIAGKINDFIDAYEVEDLEKIAKLQPMETNSGYHIRFKLDNLSCNKQYKYKIISEKGYDLKVLPAIGEETSSELKTFSFITPPPKGEKYNAKIVLLADQEINNPIPDNIPIIGKLDNVADKIFHLGMDQGKLTTKIYKDIGAKKPDLVLHGGDRWSGEDSVKRKLRTIVEFQDETEKDFHNTIRSELASSTLYVLDDDHDYGQNDINKEEFERDSGAIYNALQTKESYLSTPKIEEAKNLGTFYNVTLGDIEIICLHNRLECVPNKTLLGECQINWLELKLKEARDSERTIIIESPLPFAVGKKAFDDYRSTEEFHILLQLFAKYDVSFISCADSHNCSVTDLHIQIEGTNEIKIIPQILKGDLGGRSQEISPEEVKCITKNNGRPLFSDNPEINLERDKLYGNSKLITYYSSIYHHNKAMVKALQSSGLQRNSVNKSYYNNGKWCGNDLAGSQFGYALLERKQKENIDHIKEDYFKLKMYSFSAHEEHLKEQEKFRYSRRIPVKPVCYKM